MKRSTELFEYEGKQNVAATIKIVADAVTEFGIKKVLIFASHAENVVALRKALPRSNLILAVTFPMGMTAQPSKDAPPISIGMPSTEERHRLQRIGVPLLQGIMPLRGLGENASPVLDAVMRVFALWGGGMELCVQAALMACDAGYLSEGERCIVMTADTAVVLRAGNAFRFLKPHSMAAIEHVLCKPLNYQITRAAALRMAEPTTTIEHEPGRATEAPPPLTAIGHQRADVKKSTTGVKPQSKKPRKSNVTKKKKS